MQTPQEFVKEIAEESPITAVGWDNICKFCQTNWAEESFDEYLKNEKNPDPIRSWEHHDSDCLWVRANQIMREGKCTTD